MKRVLYGFLLLCLVVGLSAPAWAAPAVVMTARAANEGRVRPGGWVTVTVDLTNQGWEMTGELVVQGRDGSWDAKPQYVVPLTLPAGGTKRVPVTLPLQGVGNVNVRLLSGNSVVAEQNVSLTMLSPDSILIGVLSDDELGVPALARVGQSGRGLTAQVVRMEAQTFPTRASQLADFDVLAISRFDTATLTKEQLQALEAWVGRGGVLLLGGGPEWKRTFAPLPSALLPVSITGTGEAGLAPLADLVGKPLGAVAPISVGEVLRGQVIARAGEAPLMVVDQVGSGRVVYLAADPSLEPMVTWAGQADLLDRYLEVSPSWAKYEFRNADGYVQDALRRIPGLGLPSLMVVASLLGGYLLLIGPVSYVLLKRMDRREWAWATVPLLSLGFVGAIYGMAFGTRSTQISHLITVTELAPGTQRAIMTSYVGIYAPSKSQLEVPLEGASLVKPLFSWGGAESVTNTRIVSGERTTVQLLGLNNYSLRGFSMEQDVAVQGGLELVETKISADGTLSARVLNRMDRPVQDLMVMGAAGREPIRLGTLEPGQTSGPLQVDLSELLQADPRWGWWGPGWSSDMDHEQIRRNIMLGSFVNQGIMQSSSGGLTVIGWTESPMAEVSLTDVGRLHQGTNMLYATLPVPIDLSDGNLPPGIIKGVPIDRDNLGYAYVGYILHQGSTVFNLNLPNFDRSVVTEVTLHMRHQSGGAFSAQVMNHRTGEWQDLTTQPTQVLSNWQDLINPAGLLQVRIATNDYVEMAAPTISLKGVER